MHPFDIAPRIEARAKRAKRTGFPMGLATAATIALLSGCTTMGTTDNRTTGSAGSELYAGEPAVVHATELPVASAGEARFRAQAALAERDIDLALHMYVQAVNLDPEDAVSLYAIGAIHTERGNLELASRAYSRVIELEPDHALAHQGLGLALFQERRFEEAEVQLHAAVQSDPTLWRSQNALGIIADRNEQYGVAADYYGLAIEAQPQLASLHNNRGYSRYLAGQFDDAKRDFLAALELDGDYGLAWRNLGLVLAREQAYERALSAMTHAIDRHVALNDIGYVAMLDGDYSAARHFFEEAILASPRHYQTARDNLEDLDRRTSSRASLSID